MSGTQPTKLMSARRITEVMAASGRPNNGKEIAQIARLCVATGLTPKVAMQVAALAYDARYTFAIHGTARVLERIAREDHAERCPNGQWAHLIRYHGRKALYWDENDMQSEMRKWSSLPGPREAIARDFELV